MIDDKEWQEFALDFELDQCQLEQFYIYADLLITWSRKINLTTEQTISAIIERHFRDSLSVSRFLDFSALKTIADVGAGAGFPSLPLKLKFPHLKLVLIEVNSKKRHFLATVCQQLQLEQIEICDQDWRTFLRHAALDIDLFCARASLPVAELLRIFKPSSLYSQARLIYWASQHWQPRGAEKLFLEKRISYRTSATAALRQLIFWKN